MHFVVITLGMLWLSGDGYIRAIALILWSRYVVAIALCLSKMSLLVSHGYRVRYVVGVGLGMSWLSL